MTLILILFIFSFSIFIFIIMFYNGFVNKKNKINEAWSGIEIQLKRRYSLIPNLLSTIKAIAAHEESIFDKMTDSLSERMQAQGTNKQVQAETKIQQSINQIINLAAKYPELKANENFLDFQNTLEEIEKHIEMARRYYNAVVRDYNTNMERFPNVIVAKLFGFQSFNYYEIENFETVKNNPEVKF